MGGNETKRNEIKKFVLFEMRKMYCTKMNLVILRETEVILLSHPSRNRNAEQLDLHSANSYANNISEGVF